MLVHTKPLRDAAGTIVRWIGSAVDVTELRALKEQLHKENIAHIVFDQKDAQRRTLAK